MKSQWYGKFLLILCALFLVGCGTNDLYNNLSESDANTIVGVLLARDVQAIKRSGKEGVFAVAVPKEQFAKAVEILKWYGIPQESFNGIGKVFAKSGIVSSPTEEKIRFMYALSQDIAETLSQLDGVVSSRVNLVLPKNDPYTETTTPSSASVFLKCRPGFDSASLLPQIKALVMNSVEGLAYDRISVTIIESRSMDLYYPIKNEPTMNTVLGMNMAPDSVKSLWGILGAASLVAIIIGAGAGIALFSFFRRERQEETPREVASAE
ncbi:MAG: EscJ/YscJ/HrcJ family type III secretion inner membrane ring protein [Verrucomicrobia bacterium]|nr:MAG: EscJ/YscJ/HrcJ family type III secretion inner membrane ring protein [Verrucomicrobiota bacterium]